MSTLFTKIIDGQIPGRFVWKDPEVVAFLTIAPLRPGHTLVVPRKEVDHWLDLEPPLLAHLFAAAQHVGRGVHRAFPSKKVGVLVAGLEVPHVHIHVTPIDGLNDMDFAQQDTHADPRDLDAAADKIRKALRDLGYAQVSG